MDALVRYRFILLFMLLEAICLGASAQDNDNCADAIELEVGSQCQSKTYSNTTATAQADSVAPDPSCGLYKGGDVWFTAVMPASGALRIETDNLEGATPHCITIYSGVCGNFTEISCIRQDKERTFLAPSLAGEKLYMRVFGLNGAGGSSFELCAWEPPIPVNDNCGSAIELPVGETCAIGKYTNAYATAQPADTAPEPSCGQYRGGDVWFKAVVPASGNLRVETHNLAGATPKSVAIYTGSCGAFTEAFCLQLDFAHSFYDTNWAGQTVYIRIFNYASEEGGDFELCVSSPTEPFNDDCDEAMALTVGENCNPQVFTNALASAEATAPDPSCGQYRGGDVWFKTIVPASGQMRIETDNLEGATNKSFTVYEGKCGAFTEMACSQLDPYLAINDTSLAGQTVYIRLFSYGTEEGSRFNICAVETHCSSATTNAVTFHINEGNSFQFGGKTLSAGVYLGTFQTVEGCDSLVTLTLVVEPITGLSPKKDPETELKIFPNPASGSVMVELGGNSRNGNIEMLNLNGQRLTFQKYHEKSRVQIDLGQRPRGVYLIKIDTGKRISIVKLIKE